MPSEQEYIVLFNALLSSTRKAYSFPIARDVELTYRLNGWARGLQFGPLFCLVQLCLCRRLRHLRIRGNADDLAILSGCLRESVRIVIAVGQSHKIVRIAGL